ncbi:MAG: diguanylate cyclase [Ketobacteraceae bacterium]|nr:diguanylate cyclase [Ketobacteraceae bacterium]
MPILLVILLLFTGGYALADESEGIIHTDTTPLSVSIRDRAFYFVDGSGQAKPFLEANIPTLKERYGFRPLSGLPENIGYEHRVHWLLVSLDGIDIPAEHRFFEYDYPLIDHLDAYFKTGDGDWQPGYRTGDMLPYESRPVNYRIFYFPIPAEKNFMLLRIQTEGSLVMPVAVVNGQRILEHMRHSTLVYGLFFGALGIMCIYNLFVYFFTRETSYFYYVSTLFFILLYLLAMSGYGYELLWRENGQWVNEHIQPITVGLILACVSLFTKDVLKLSVFLPRLALCFTLLSRACFGIALAGFFLPLRSLIHLISFMPILTIGLTIIAAVYGVRENIQGARLFLIAWSAGLLGAFLFALHQLGVLPSHPLFVHSLKFGVLFNTVLLSFSLVSHINSLRAEKLRAEEMAHENYRLALIDGLTNIPNRRAFDHQYRLEYRRSQREKSPLSILMVDVDFFKSYNDNYGHRKGDAVLRTVAKKLTECLARPADSVFRYGGEEFVVMLPDTDAAGAEYLAQRMVEQVAAQSIPHSSSPWQQLTISIGGTTELHFQQDLLAVLEMADEALYQAKNTGRNRYVFRKPNTNIRQFHSPQPRKGG